MTEVGTGALPTTEMESFTHARTTEAFGGLAWWCSSCRSRVDTDDGLCLVCRGAVERCSGEPRPIAPRPRRSHGSYYVPPYMRAMNRTHEIRQRDGILKVCAKCGLERLHPRRADRPKKPRPLCYECTSAYRKGYRADNWQAEKARDTWKGMINRCHNPKAMKKWAFACKFAMYRDYGAVGVKVCSEWRDPETGLARFIADVGLPPSKEHTLDRRNPRRNYTKSNVRWVLPGVQGANRKNTVWVTAKDPNDGVRKTLSLSDWARTVGVDRRVIAKRLKDGLVPDEAVAHAVPQAQDEVPF